MRVGEEKMPGYVNGHSDPSAGLVTCEWKTDTTGRPMRRLAIGQELKCLTRFSLLMTYSRASDTSLSMGVRPEMEKSPWNCPRPELGQQEEGCARLISSI